MDSSWPLGGPIKLPLGIILFMKHENAPWEPGFDLTGGRRPNFSMLSDDVCLFILHLY